MYNQTATGVRRAHSFDSSDNLERWQAIREQRRQFLSARAKFDKKPPSEPPPPPPREDSKHRASLNSARLPSAIRDDVNLILQQLKKTNFQTNERGSASGFSSPEYEGEPSRSFQSYLTDKTNTLATHDAKEEKPNSFLPAGSQKSLIELKQRWHRYKAHPFDGAEDVKVISTTPKAHSFAGQGYCAVREPEVVKKMVDNLGYEVPTHFQEISMHTNTSRKLFHSVENDWTDSSTETVDLRYGERQPETNLSDKFCLKRPSDYYKRNSAPATQSPSISVVRYNSTSQKLQDYSLEDRKQSVKEDSKRYLQSNLKMFTDSLLDETSTANPNDEENQFISSKSDLVRSAKPRRTSTGSMHDPMIWRSHYSGTPVKELVQKFSNDKSHKN